MYKNIEFADIAINTHDPEFYNLLIDDKLKILEFSLESLNKRITDKNTGSIKGILIAPEYFFAKSMAQNETRQYSESEYICILQKITKLSSKYSGILIVPGTIAWIEPTPEDASKDEEPYGNFASVPYRRDKDILTPEQFDNQQISIGLKPLGQDYLNYMKQPADSSVLKAMLKMNTSDAYKIGRSRNSTAPSNFPKHKKEMLETTSLGKLGLGYNTAFFYLNGKQLHHYTKIADYEEILKKEPNVYVPGSDGPVVNISNINFGIEICLDHDCGILKEYINKNSELFNPLHTSISKSGGVNIHIILSAPVGNKEENYCVENGYLLHSSSDIAERRYQLRQAVKYYQKNTFGELELESKTLEKIDVDCKSDFYNILGAPFNLNFASLALPVQAKFKLTSTPASNTTFRNTSYGHGPNIPRNIVPSPNFSLPPNTSPSVYTSHSNYMGYFSPTPVSTNAPPYRSGGYGFTPNVGRTTSFAPNYFFGPTSISAPSPANTNLPTDKKNITYIEPAYRK